MYEYTLRLGGGEWKVSLHAPDDRPVGEPGSCESIVMINDHTTMLIREVGGRLNTPGDRPRDGESIEDAMRRAVRTKACAEAISCQLLAFTRTERLDGAEAGKIMVGCMFASRVDLLPWVPSEGVVDRVEVPLSQLADVMTADWVGLEDFSAELVACAQRALVAI